MRDIGGHALNHREIHTALIVFISVLLTTIAIITSGCGKKEVSLDYQPNPNLTIVTVKSDGGLPYPGDDLYPKFQLFGDGRVIKYQEGPDWRGILLQGKLDEEETVDLLQGIADTGFFELKQEYRDPSISDATYRNITVNLVETEKTVWVWMMKKVSDFDAVYDLIMDYPLGEATEYVPQQGYLVVVRYPNEARGGQDFLDPNSDIYKLLPDNATLSQAAASSTAAAVAGDIFLKIKNYENQLKSRGLYISQQDGYLVVFPVYEPRTAKKP